MRHVPAWLFVVGALSLVAEAAAALAAFWRPRPR
jgi:hypothetical protein